MSLLPYFANELRKSPHVPEGICEARAEYNRTCESSIFQKSERTCPMEMQEGMWWSRFQALLDEQEEWPALYTFKFIAPEEQLGALKDLFERHPVKVRSSSKGNYVSVTARLKMESSEDVLAVYEAAGAIDDVIAL